MKAVIVEDHREVVASYSGHRVCAPCVALRAGWRSDAVSCDGKKNSSVREIRESPYAVDVVTPRCSLLGSSV